MEGSKLGGLMINNWEWSIRTYVVGNSIMILQEEYAKIDKRSEVKWYWDENLMR